MIDQKLKIITLINEKNYYKTKTQIFQQEEIQFLTKRKCTMTYKNKIDKRANKFVELNVKQLKVDFDRAKKIAVLRKKNLTNIYYFFENATNYAFAREFYRFKLIKKDVNNLF